MGLVAGAHPRNIAIMPEGDYLASIAEWQVDDKPPTVAMKSVQVILRSLPIFITEDFRK